MYACPHVDRRLYRVHAHTTRGRQLWHHVLIYQHRMLSRKLPFDNNHMPTFAHYDNSASYK